MGEPTNQEVSGEFYKRGSQEKTPFSYLSRFCFDLPHHFWPSFA
jgi:hypothetical protein